MSERIVEIKENNYGRFVILVEYAWCRAFFEYIDDFVVSEGVSELDIQGFSLGSLESMLIREGIFLSIASISDAQSDYLFNILVNHEKYLLQNESTTGYQLIPYDLWFIEDPITKILKLFEGEDLSCLVTTIICSDSDKDSGHDLYVFDNDKMDELNEKLVEVGLEIRQFHTESFDLVNNFFEYENADNLEIRLLKISRVKS